jgi:hypothetical protein
MGIPRYLATTAAAAALLAATWVLDSVRVPRLPAGASATRGAVRILKFYATADAVSPGHPAQLCYGVENARNVWISPEVPGVYPSSGRCLDVVPDHTTLYTILAEGFDGAVDIRSLTVPVDTSPPPPSVAVNVAFLLF